MTSSLGFKFCKRVNNAQQSNILIISKVIISKVILSIVVVSYFWVKRLDAAAVLAYRVTAMIFHQNSNLNFKSQNNFSLSHFHLFLHVSFSLFFCLSAFSLSFSSFSISKRLCPSLCLSSLSLFLCLCQSFSFLISQSFSVFLCLYHSFYVSVYLSLSFSKCL